MNANSIVNQFARMGARFKLVRPEDVPVRRRRADYALEIGADQQGQFFEMQLGAERELLLKVHVLQVQPQQRHLVRLVKTPMVKDRFLCGHYEREW